MNTSFLNIFKISILSFLLFSPSLHALELANDQFESSSDNGYSRDDGDSNELEIDRDKTSSKTYNFGSTYANATLLVSFDVDWKSGWEDSGSAQDYFNVWFNTNLVVDDSFDGSGGTSYSLTTTADSNGKLLIAFSPNTTANSEIIQIDNVIISSAAAPLPIVENADDLCYDTTSTDGICGGIMSLGCTITTPIVNATNSNLTNVQAVLGTSSLFSAFSDCGVDGSSGNCEDSSALSIMALSAFTGGINYTLPNYGANETHTTYNQALFSFLNSSYDWVATYEKDGATYQGTISPCDFATPPPEPVDETLPTSDPQPQVATCDSFADMFQTRGTCSGTSGGTVAFTNAGSLLDGSTNIIIDNNDNEINTCQVTADTWISNDFETCGTSGDCSETGTAAEPLTIDYTNIPTIANVSTSPTSSTDDITLDGTITLTGYTYNAISTSSYTNTSTTFDITNQLQINSLTMTTGNTFAFSSSNPYSLEIGTLGIENNGATNTVITDANAKNIKINTFNLSSSTTLALTAQQTLQMDNFTVGRGSNVVLKAQYVNINNFTSSNDGSGDSEITIYADYIDIGNLTLGQTVTLNILPYTAGKRILFRTNTLQESSSSPILISSGNYYVNTSLIMPGTDDVSALRAVDGNQIINFYINADFTPGNNPGINALGNNANYDLSLPAANFMLFVNGAMTTGGGGTTINATMYIEGDASFGNPTYIKGAISAQNISIGQGQFTYDQSLDGSGFGKCSEAPIITDSLRDFTIRNPLETRNIKGNIKVIGNSVLCWKDGGSTCKATTQPNNDTTLSFIDTDTTTDHSPYNNSSQAKIEGIPDNATVIWAGFYSQGYLNKSLDDMSQTLQEDPSYLITPNGTSITIYPQNIDLYQWNGYTYSTFSEVTELIDMNGTEVNGYWTGANIKAREGKDTSLGYFAAWTLVIIYKDVDETLKNISVFDGYKRVSSSSSENEITINIDGFLTPKSGTIASELALFVGEGDSAYTGDKLYVNDIGVNTTNAFSSSTSGFIANPALANNFGIDIQNHDIGSTGLNIIKNADTTAQIKLTSSGDAYFPSMVSFTTELYEPRVCYYIDTIVDQNDKIIFENAAFTAGSTINNNEEYTFNFFISNMKKDANETDIEIAELVQIYLNSTNFTYTPNSTFMQNTGTSAFTQVTDGNNFDGSKDDLGEYLNSKSTWRVGYNASSLQGGTLYEAANFNDVANIAKVMLKGSLSINSNATNINLSDFLEFKASFQTDTITIAEENAQPIAQCQDLNDSGSVGAPASTYNAVITSFTSATDPILGTDPLNALPTQVSNRAFSIKIVSLDSNDLITLSQSAGDVNVSIIQTPAYTGNALSDQELCDAAVPINNPVPLTMDGLSDNDITLTNTTQAYKSASIKITSNLNSDTPLHSCSRDVFAIRPDRFLLSLPGQDIELLHSGKDYNFQLIAAQALVTTPTPNYTITNAKSILTSTLDSAKIIYNLDGSDGTNTLAGTLNLAAVDFNILNGISIAQGGIANNIIGINFSDVGKVNLNFQDVNWSKVDIDNGDTPLDCSANGAYICGSIDAIFIPDHFGLNAVSLSNYNGATYTYISSDLNISAGLNLTLTAENFLNNTTMNFTSTAWENPVNLTFTLPAVTDTSVVANKSEAANNQNISFTSGSKIILSTDTNTSTNLVFNYNRNQTTPVNPFTVDGTLITLNATSLYTSTSGATDTIVGSAPSTQNARFIYGRTHAPRHRFTGDTGTVFIYYEAYCSGTENGNTCDKTLLPNGTPSDTTDDPRWFINGAHIVSSGNVGTISQKNAASVTAAAPTGASIANVVLTYDATNGYPYKTTMENNASSWLIYNQYDAGTPTNEFEVEFTNSNSTWAGQAETDTMTNRNASDKTNRRSMW